MTYLITQILLCLIIAFLLGMLLGYLLSKMCCSSKCKTTTKEKDVTTAKSFSSPYVDDVDDTAMINLDTDVELDSDEYVIETLEGIGPQTGELLRGYGVTTVGDYLRKLHAPAARKQAAKDLNILEKPLHDWASMSDLLRIEGINHQHAELTYATGIATIGDLAHSNAEELAGEMDAVNKASKQLIAPTVPSVDDLNNWIASARGMSPVVTV